MEWKAAPFIASILKEGTGLSPVQIANEFTFGQIMALSDTAAPHMAADPTALRPGEQVISSQELAALIERRKARAR